MVSHILQGMRFKSAALALAASFALAACGGGGGSPGETLQSPTVGLAVFDASGASTNTVTLTPGVVVRATVRNGANELVPNAVVQLQASGLTYNPTSGAALTNANGVAEIGIVADGTVSGGVTIKALTAVGAKNATAIIGVSAIVPPAPAPVTAP